MKEDDVKDINEEHLDTWWNNRSSKSKKMIYFKWFNVENPVER